MATVAAHEILATEDCLLRGCGWTAEPGSAYCALHRSLAARTIRCPYCPDWTYTGRKEHGEFHLAEHVRDRHPDRLEPPPPPKRSRPRDVFPITPRPRRTKEVPPMPMRKRLDPERHELYLRQFREFHEEHGRWPLPIDSQDEANGLPSRDQADAYAGGWQGLWDELGAGKIPQGRAAQKYRSAIYQEVGLITEGAEVHPVEAAGILPCGLHGGSHPAHSWLTGGTTFYCSGHPDYTITDSQKEKVAVVAREDDVVTLAEEYAKAARATKDLENQYRQLGEIIEAARASVAELAEQLRTHPDLT